MEREKSMKKKLCLSVLGLFFRNYCRAQEEAYKSATLSARKEMYGYMRYLRNEVGMSQRVINRI